MNGRSRKIGLAASIIAVFALSALQGAAQNYRVFVFGKPIRFSGGAEPYWKSNTMVIPADPVLRAGAATFRYERGDKILAVRQGRGWMTMQDGSRMIDLPSGADVRARTEAKVFEGILHVPTEFLERALGVKSQYDSRTRTIYFGGDSGGNQGGGWGGNKPWDEDDHWGGSGSYNFNQTRSGTGRMSLGQGRNHLVTRVQVRLMTNGSAEIRATTSGGNYTFRGRYRRNGNVVNFDLDSGWGTNADYASGNMRLLNNNRDFSYLTIAGTNSRAPFELNFNAN